MNSTALNQPTLTEIVEAAILDHDFLFPHGMKLYKFLNEVQNYPINGRIKKVRWGEQEFTVPDDNTKILETTAKIYTDFIYDAMGSSHSGSQISEEDVHSVLDQISNIYHSNGSGSVILTYVPALLRDKVAAVVRDTVDQRKVA